MILEINGKEYELYFGMDFIREIDKMYPLNSFGMDMKVGGLPFLNTALAMRNPVALVNVIKAGTSTLPQKPSTEDVEIYVTERIIQEGPEKVFKEFDEEIKKQPFLIALIKNAPQVKGKK